MEQEKGKLEICAACGKEIPKHVMERGEFFCMTSCRNHFEHKHGKSRFVYLCKWIKAATGEQRDPRYSVALELFPERVLSDKSLPRNLRLGMESLLTSRGLI